MTNNVITPTLMYRLNNLGPRVAQKADVGGKYIYALQRVKGDVVVHRAKPTGENVNYTEKTKCTTLI